MLYSLWNLDLKFSWKLTEKAGMVYCLTAKNTLKWFQNISE